MSRTSMSMSQFAVYMLSLVFLSGLLLAFEILRRMRKMYKRTETFWSMRVTTLQGARSAFTSPVPPDFRELGFVMSMLGQKQGGPALEFVDLSKDFKDLQEYRIAQPQSYFLKYGGRPTSSPVAMMQSPSGLGQVQAMVIDDDPWSLTIHVSAAAEPGINQAITITKQFGAVPQGITITKQYGEVTLSDGWVLAQGAGSHITTLTNPEGQEVASLAARPKVGWAFRVQRSLPELEQLKVLTMLAVAHPWTPIKIFRQQLPAPTALRATAVAPPAGSMQPTVVGAAAAETWIFKTSSSGSPVVVAAAAPGVAGGAAGAGYVYPGFEEYGQPGWTGGRGTLHGPTDRYNGDIYAGGGDTEANPPGDFGWDDPGDFDAGGDGFGGWDAGGGGGDGGFGDGGFGGGDGGFGGDGGGFGGGDGGGFGGGDGGGGGGGDGGGGGGGE